ncbi:hypothetical protein LXL04_006281 [Taraxacum kok-saghyz]
MKTMVWNVRGLCNTSTQKEVVSMLDRNKITLCALLETRVHMSRINNICRRIKGNWNWYSNASITSTKSHNAKSKINKLDRNAMKGARAARLQRNKMVQNMKPSKVVKTPEGNEAAVKQVVKSAVKQVVKSAVKPVNLHNISKAILWSLYTGTRIAIGWDPGAWDVFVIHSYDQVVHCKILNKHSNQTFCMSFIYAENDYRNRRILWEYLRAHQNLVKDEPWLVSGYFNQILKPGESTRSSSFDSYMDDFQRCIEDTNLIDINATGLYYTWNQKPRGVGGLLRKSDRTMGNTNILSLFPRINVMYKPYGISDQSPAVIEFPIGKPKKSYDFKFVNTIADHPQFLDTVQLHWNSRIDGHSMYQVFQKLKNLKPPIRKISHQMGNPSKKVEARRTEVEKDQEQLDREPDNEELSFEHATYLDEFIKALSEEESLFRQKAKLNWLKDGDRNTKYYHKVIKEKQNRNRLKSITDGEWIVHGADKVTEVALDYFSDFLGKSRDMEPISSPNDLFTNTLSTDEANWMIRPVNDEEIKQALFDIGNDKAPGPDGYTSTFFKKSWHIVGKDVCLAVKEFFLNGQLLQAINHTILALLPKVENPNTMKDFRPISCCNVIYKCITKIIVNRMAPSLHKLVDVNQSAFIPGRVITDNILLSQELMKGYTCAHGSPRCALKVDIQKAYDTVNWNFLN